MTAPVTQRPGATEGEAIGMTAPVTQRATAQDEHIVRFVMPARYRLEDLPQPSDTRIQIRREPEKVVAVQLSDRTLRKVNRELKRELEDELDGDGVLARTIKTVVRATVRGLLDLASRSPTRQIHRIQRRWRDRLAPG